MMLLRQLFIFAFALVVFYTAPASYAQESKMLYMQRGDVDEVEGMERDEVGIKTSSGEILYFNVEMALTADQQAKGMMYREHMGDFEGMFFLFPNEKMRSFWMKNTLIPLDMLFLDHAGRIHHIHHRAQPQNLSHITSKFPSKAVLELKGGMADQLSIGVGDVVIHDAFMNTETLTP